jgi:hypothetical protein
LLIIGARVYSINGFVASLRIGIFAPVDIKQLQHEWSAVFDVSTRSSSSRLMLSHRLMLDNMNDMNE